MSKLLTGEMIYKTLSDLVSTGNYCIDEDNITPSESQIYNDLAEKLNEQLGLVEPTTLQGGLFEDCSFVLRYSPYHNDRVEASNLEVLYDLIKEYVPMPDPGLSRRYVIDVMKGSLKMGTGIYERTPVSTDVIGESGVAQGLNDALYKYAVENV